MGEVKVFVSDGEGNSGGKIDFRDDFEAWIGWCWLVGGKLARDWRFG